MTQTKTPAAPGDRKDLSGRPFRQLIDGQLVAGASEVPVVDPATEEIIAKAPVADRNQLEQAVAAAKSAFQTWRNVGHERRVEAIRKIADAVAARREEIARATTLEVGKPITAARMDVDLALLWARQVAEVSLEPEILQDDEQAYITMHRRPIGVVAAIIPWNFPFFQTVYKVIPAILTGNTVVVKPSPTTPLNAMILGEILQDVLPAGVVNIIGDNGHIGPLLAEHPDIGKVSFTGSTVAGRKVMASAAPTLKRVVLELGGNDAAIVLEDADVAKAARDIFTWAFMNSGQVCINIKRIFVHESIYDAFCDAFAGLADAAVVGHGLDETTQYGPVQNRRQYETALRCLEIAQRDGKVIAGGARQDGKGYFVRPTVVRDIPDTSDLVREETFGPIRPIMKYSSIDDVVRRVNDTDYGLGGSVWGRDIDLAAKVAARIDSGTTWVNSHFALSPGVPFGGRKQSGLGTEFGLDGIHEYTDRHVINVSRA
ncbi:aldehyde dehydrogenase family protein [Methylobacterium sp. J-068]|uniref:aldehyde dehydrogenase family protein n=1 Tax=Methylobacterium sp. J-068 TaxID=2836649 RepID=UPI001FBA1AFC|nr:aldehyde dehydrogenase family protein [Methylobacterium sp. J-068]MCJ2033966.1 aldehyde dehydrogenase family protein [Methylobacterium sp. J-068]